jgi:hypothetical protein
MRDFQKAVRQWVLACFGKEVADDIPTRCFRFFEEASELCQSLGMRKEDAHKLVDYVWGRPVGEPRQETGGTMVTLAAMLTPVDIDADDAGWMELTRCWQNIDKIRAKQKSKAAIGLGADPIPGSADVGKWITLYLAVQVDSLHYLPQMTNLKILRDLEDAWEVYIPDSAQFTGIYRLSKHLCSHPRDQQHER